ncbi:double-strand break repair protein AddB [Parvibaculum sp.]|uniref:double-strand break repair protein AddB n=1 Tax=Parvibaculum sp. TaxID=2024848 RepID=UPI00320FF129
MAHDSPRLFTIPSGTPFLDALARTLLADPTLGGRFGAGVELPDITILLPTRRAVRALSDAFLRAGGGKALLLPIMRPLGDVDEDELVLDISSQPSASLTLPPEISGLERQFRLARLILDLDETDESADLARALALAADLGRFLDMALTERVALTSLGSLVPEEFAEYWQITIEFLKLLTERWPEELARLGFMEGAARRNALLESQAAAWTKSPPAKPVIAAGSTGSIPAAADLLAVVARLAAGAVVLPGLDTELDAESWNAIGGKGTESHPQYGLKKLLMHLRAERDDVALWPGVDVAPARRARMRLLSEALRPADTTSLWRSRLDLLRPDADAALEGLSLVTAPTQREEAGAIALLMRGALETQGKTAALITPDRALGRRVAAELRRWGIEIDDSGGRPLAHTPPMIYLRLVAELVAEDFAPLTFLAALKHPLAGLGNPARLRDEVRRLERLVLRGPRPAPGLAGLRAALAEAHKAAEARDAPVKDFAGLDGLLDRIETALRPLIDLYGREAPVADIARAHVAAAEALAFRGEGRTPELWAKEEGEAASTFVVDLIESAATLGACDLETYARLFAELGMTRVLRPRFGRHPRLFIWGPLEARLQHADCIILGSLNEGTWPAEANIDPWLNRPMRAALGLEPPERHIGLSAHDFAEGASAAEVVLTRALKVDGAPTVASRWLLRLQSLLAGLGRAEALDAPNWAGWAQKLDEAGDPIPIGKPRPTPPLEARPKRFSVTEIETLIRDPYAIYAKRVLNLRPLDPIDADGAGAERGNIIHEALEKFARAYPQGLPANALDELIRIGRETFAHALDRPGVAAFWWPRFKRIAAWIVDYEERLRADVKRVHAEVKGEIEIVELAHPVKLVGKADRIDERRDGTVRIIDYKTGAMPSLAQVEAGLTPQLPLEAAMIARGGFKDIGAATASALLYLRLTGGEKAGEARAIEPENLVEETYANLVALLASYEDEATPYLSRPRPMFEASYGDYDHLARVKEWSSAGGGE